jgi:hypothetical protein
MVSRYVSESGIGRGPLVLFGSFAALEWTAQLVQVGVDVGMGTLWPRTSLHFVERAWVVAVALLVMWLRPPQQWPATSWRDIRYDTPVDVVFAVIVSSAFTLGAFDVHGFLILDRWSDHRWWGLTALVALVPLWRGGGVSSLEHFIAAAAAFVVPLLAWFVGVRSANGTIPAFVRQGLLHDGYNYRVTLRSEDSHGTDDVSAIAARLHAVGYSVEVERVTPHEIALRATSLHPQDPNVIDRALVQHRASIHWLARDQSPLDPRPGESHPGVWEGAQTVPLGRQRPLPVSRYVAADPELLAPTIASAHVPPGTFAAVFCATVRHDVRDCTPWLLESAAVVEARDVEHVGVRMDGPDGRLYVYARLDPRGTDRFAAETEARAGEMLGIVIDGRIVSRPVVNTSIRDGIIRIVPHRGLHGAALSEEISEDAAAFGPALYATWTRVTYALEP